MAQALEKNMFCVKWRIENFSMCPQKKGDSIISPDFVVNALDKTKWFLVLYPKGDNQSDCDYISCYLNRSYAKGEPIEVTIDYSITLLKVDASSVLGCNVNETFSEDDGYGYKNFETIKNISECKDIYTPNDVFTVVCCMRRETPSSQKNTGSVSVPIYSRYTSTYSREEFCTRISDNNISEITHTEHCILNTRIPVERRVITWVIQDFETQLRSGKKIPLKVLSNLREKSELLLSCYLSRNWDSSGSLRIGIERKDETFNQMLMRCKVSLLNLNGSAQESTEAVHLYVQNCEVWSYPHVVKLSTIEKNKCKLLLNGALTLECDILISYEGEKIVTIDEGSLENNLIGTDGLRQNIKNLLDNEELTDAVLTAEGVTLPFHKTLICALSPVFRKMFMSDTEEKRTGVVRIIDMDVQTLQNMLDYIYEGRLPDFELEDVKRLYSAADKYEILTLKTQCAASLTFNLSASNVCDILVLADLHQDADLLKHVHSFLRFRSEDVFHSREWAIFMEINNKLAGETMRKVLTRETNC